MCHFWWISDWENATKSRRLKQIKVNIHIANPSYSACCLFRIQLGISYVLGHNMLHYGNYIGCVSNYKRNCDIGT